MKIKFLSENKVGNTDCLAEHGLSILIETGNKKILFDTGAGFVISHNMEILEENPEEVDALVISHGHYDHTQGVPWFCRNNETAKVYIHEKSFAKTYGMNKGKLENITCGIRWNKREFDEIRDRLKLTTGVESITEDIIISGTIPDIHGITQTEKFFTKDEDGNLTPDDMEHEQFLLVREKDESGNYSGSYLFSGCSHKGIIPAIIYARTLFPEQKIKAVVAGLHLHNSSKEVIGHVADAMEQEGVEIFMPVHCTGTEALCAMKNRFQDKCQIAGAGNIFEI